MLQFMGDNKKLLHNHEQKFAELEALKSNSQMFQSNTNASLKNLETQVGQLASPFKTKIRMHFLVTLRKIQRTVGSPAKEWQGNE